MLGSFEEMVFLYENNNWGYPQCGCIKLPLMGIKLDLKVSDYA